ncbi:MAG: RNase P modulator RnpM [Fastidiosipilaceae bacterium]|jgi:predicted RNA-binding protein YlxR (DUF448 family)|nr:DUF448 domain-containing protein [Clostridiaceae bacterium]
MAKHVPQRMCIACRQMMPKQTLIRVVAGPEGGLRLDERGKLPGRGAYICKKQDCLNKAIGERRIEQHLKQRFLQSEVNALEKEMKKLIERETSPAAPPKDIIGRDAAGRTVRVIKRAAEKKQKHGQSK